MYKLGLVKTAAVTPKLKVANTEYNVAEILDCAREADKQGAGITLFPELAITGYTCGDLFYQDFLYQKNLDGLKEIIRSSGSIKAVLIVGFYLRLENNYYNCAAIIQGGSLRGIVPKMFMPNSKEFYEARWFTPGIKLAKTMTRVRLLGLDIPFGNLIFSDELNDFKIAVEICEDLWVPLSPGVHLALNGAHILFNPSASNDTVGKSDYRNQLVMQCSAKNICGYVYTSSGVHESTTDLVFSGDSIIAENGAILTKGVRFSRESTITYGEIDYERIKFERAYGPAFASCTSAYSDRSAYETIPLEPIAVMNSETAVLTRSYPKNPFIPSNPETAGAACSDIFHLQAAGLAKRLTHTGSKKAVIGISGGLDSTLALLVTAETFRLLGKDPKDIIAVTMPGFGTTGKTYNNALSIMKLLGAEIREISIKDSVLLHFQDIGHDKDQHDVTYENAQARERTQILMDIANKERGLVVGTGDLSEIALGWSTYNGDHMSMYSVNAGVPKSMIRFVIDWVMAHRLDGTDADVCFSSDNALLKQTLQDIMDTPISPELLPPDKDGKIAQKTEDTVGPYILHDFFMFHTLKSGLPPKKLLYVASYAFADQYDSEYIKKWLTVFYRRFFSQQFKRSCMPDGPKVGSISLSPRGDWRMPSDADVSLWLAELESV